MKLLRTIPLVLSAACALVAAPPVVGQAATDFSLKSTLGETVRLSELTAKAPVALIVLRGFPGYQCPFCQRQVREFILQEKAFSEAGVQVVFVYPGPPDAAEMRAKEAIADKNFPASMKMLVDPGYEFTNLYGLRWDARGETAYPSTFLIDQKGTVYYAKIAKLHGGRSSAAEVLELLPKKPVR